MQRHVWTVFLTLATTAAAWAARRSATALWARLNGTDSPPNPDDANVGWGAALGWAGLAGLTTGVARVMGRRGATAAWKKMTNEQPPGLA